MQADLECEWTRFCSTYGFGGKRYALGGIHWRKGEVEQI